jgi:Trehalose and maltose hydrolases (possible phosphorylases)
LKYSTGTNDLQNWLVTESSFQANFLGKCEAIFCQGNGYLGVRNALEEPYITEGRNTLIMGTFNRFDNNEVSELPNIADVTQMQFLIDGNRFSLEQGKVSDYQRTLNLKTGEVLRTFTWQAPNGKTLAFKFKRFVSKENRHLIGSHFEITAIDADVELEIKSGINAQVTNTGTQHFSEGEKRVYDSKYLQLVQTTTQSEVNIVTTSSHTIHNDGTELINPQMQIERRAIFVKYFTTLKAGATITGEKLSLYYTSRDNDLNLANDSSVKAIQDLGLSTLKTLATLGYERLFANSMNSWQEYWQTQDVKITTKVDYDQLAIRFALYHLAVFTPTHDYRVGIGAKGLSGQGYKGHSFWDTEIFIFPYWLLTKPEVARNLMKYRYDTIGSAYKKAKENGYQGAMYPWESAWKDEGETTPLWGAVDIVTGKATKIWSGIIEIHITADIIVALWQYYTATEDHDFMAKYGYEMVFQTALFWTSRLEWDESKDLYVITDVVGSDEHKEHVDNDAITNYLAYHNMEIAILCLEKVKTDFPDKYQKLQASMDVEGIVAKILTMLPKFYRPEPRPEDGLIPQDDTYLTLKDIDLTKYKNQENVGSIFNDYNLEQVNQIQVSKQADVVMVLYLLESLFDYETKKKNFEYYEARTLHDSSLSLSTHCIVGNDIGEYEKAYGLFKKATEIDLGPNMKTSDDGIHAAAMGGIWQCCVNGFGGVRIVGENLRIEPYLPVAWEILEFTIYWKEQPLEIKIQKNEFTIHNVGTKAIEFIYKNQVVNVAANTCVQLPI